MMLFRIFLVLFCFHALAEIQAQTYQRVRISCPAESRMILAATGISIDHPVEISKTYITADISEYENQVAKDAGFHTEILIPDLKAWFHTQQKNTAEKSFKTSALPVPPGFNLGSMGGYITYAELLLELDSMIQDFPTLISTGDSIGTSIEGRTIRAFKISDNPNIDENEPEILYTALHHAREPNSLMQMLYYMYYLLNNYNSDPEVTCLINNRELWFVPIVNPDGYLYNESTDPNGGGMWRKNRRDNLDGTFGVDLNRNYGANWGYDNTGSSPTTSAETYRGTAGFSEPETQAIQNFCNQREFKLALNYHTFGNLLIYPFGYAPNMLTPDSAVFTQYAQLLTSVNNYTYGTGMETVGYVTNGDSDDWMYSEQTTKDKIFSMTPEAGDPSDGFWPSLSQILPFCEDNLKANLYHAWLGGEYVRVTSALQQFPDTNSFWLPLKFNNIGLNPATPLTAVVQIIDPNVLSVNNSIQIASLASLSSLTDSFQLQLAPGILQGTPVKVAVHTQFTGCYTRIDTLTFIYGKPYTVFTSDFENSNGNWTGNGGWALSTEDSYSPVTSMTDSPNSDYAPNEFSSVTLTQPVDLTGYVSPRAEFYARWRIEKGYDYCQLRISVNNGPFTGVATTRTVTGTQDQLDGEPLYDGIKPWGKETLDLTPYTGQNVRFRFIFNSDGFAEDEGYFFDDFEVLGYTQTPINTSQDIPESGFSVYPNPADKFMYIKWNENHETLVEYQIVLTDLSGKVILRNPLNPISRISVEDLPAGMYLYSIVKNEVSVQTGKLILNSK